MRKKHSDLSWILIQFNTCNSNTLEDEKIIGIVIFDRTKAANEAFSKKGVLFMGALVGKWIYSWRKLRKCVENFNVLTLEIFVVYPPEKIDLFLKSFPPRKIGMSLHKVCENTRFHWPVFSRIRIESATSVSENPYCRIFYALCS